MSRSLRELGLEIDENCFTTDSDNTESKRNELWKNLSKPILKNNKKKYKEKLTQREIKMIETICKNNMVYLNYPIETNANWKDTFGLYRNFVLPNKRLREKKKNEAFYENKMSSLSSKIQLLERLKNEIRS